MRQTKKQSVSKIYRTDPLLRQHLVCLESEWMNLQDVSFRKKKGSCQVFLHHCLRNTRKLNSGRRRTLHTQNRLCIFIMANCILIAQKEPKTQTSPKFKSKIRSCAKEQKYTQLLRTGWTQHNQCTDKPEVRGRIARLSP